MLASGGGVPNQPSVSTRAQQENDLLDNAPVDVEMAAAFIDIAHLTPAELEPLLMSEYGQDCNGQLGHALQAVD